MHSDNVTIVSANALNSSMYSIIERGKNIALNMIII